jgi:hypothetical protein
VLAPPGIDAAAVLSPDELGAVLEADPATESVAPAVGPADRGSESGVFSKGGLQEAPAGEDPSLAQLADSLLPYYREAERKSERAELVIEDLSLRLDNPYIASSLVPPAQRGKTVSKRVVAGLGAALLAAAGGGALLMQLHLAAPAPAEPARRAPPRAVLSAPTQAVQASSKDVERAKSAPIAAVSPAPPVPVAAPVQPAEPAPPSGHAPRAVGPAQPKLPVIAPSAAAPKPKAAAPVAAAAAPVSASVPDSATQQRPAAAAPAQPAVAATEGAVALPETPTRAEVAAGFEAIRGALVACAEGKPGQLDIDATVANSGRVSHALIEGAFKGSSAGSCMARAVRTARFPQVSRPNLKVRYAIAL